MKLIHSNESGLNLDLNCAMWGLISAGSSVAILVRNTDSVLSCLSCTDPFQVPHSMPFSFYREKFSFKLSMISVLSIGRPSLDRSLIKAPFI